jgi:hypothetical protein
MGNGFIYISGLPNMNKTEKFIEKGVIFMKSI